MQEHLALLLTVVQERGQQDLVKYFFMTIPLNKWIPVVKSPECSFFFSRLAGNRVVALSPILSSPLPCVLLGSAREIRFRVGPTEAFDEGRGKETGHALADG